MTLTIDVGTAGKVIAVLAFAGVGIAIVALLVSRVRGFFASRAFEVRDRETMRRRWREIEQMLSAPGEMSRKVAVLEADKLLDYALKALAMPGTTLGERLKFAQYKYPELRDVWWAHKVRNQLAHEASYHLDPSVARSALKAFEKALTRVGAI
ncbi:MAG TPA: hypothetical protein VL426_03890 [Candidatus Binatia bacterium]|jgi:hypothetical protein|nr:hypothetical protein [Candidatus Binatia bacterium]